MQCSHSQRSNNVFVNPWFYWLNYLNWINTQPLIPTADPTSSAPCIAEDYCLDGDLFNKVSCQCEPVTTKMNHSKISQPPLIPQNTTCSLQCHPGQSLDTEECICKCKYDIRCIGLMKYNFDTCKCQCTYPYHCDRNEYFNTYLCVCVPIIIYIQQPTTSPRIQPATIQSIPMTSCIPKLCTGYQQFSFEKCDCYCPTEEASKHCTGNKNLNPDTCQCTCSTSAAITCGNAEYFDNNDCICKCRISTTVCTTSQFFNQSTCQCECQSVTVHRQILTDQTNFQILESGLSVRKRMIKHRKKTNSRTPTRHHDRTTKTRNKQQVSQNVYTERQLILDKCPVGTIINQSDCSCH